MLWGLESGLHLRDPTERREWNCESGMLAQEYLVEKALHLAHEKDQGDNGTQCPSHWRMSTADMC